MNGRLLDREPERQLDQHLGAAEFRRVDAAGRVVDRLARRDQLPRFRFLQLARIGQLRGDLLVLVELLDRRFVGDRQRDHVAPFVALSDPEQLHPRRRLLERLVVADDVGVIGELAGLARHVAEELQRRRHGGRHRHVIDQLGRDARVRRRLLDPRGVLLVQLLRASRCSAGPPGRGHRRRRRNTTSRQDGEREASTHARAARWTKLMTPPGKDPEEYTASRLASGQDARVALTTSGPSSTVSACALPPATSNRIRTASAPTGMNARPPWCARLRSR